MRNKQVLDTFKQTQISLCHKRLRSKLFDQSDGKFTIILPLNGDLLYRPEEFFDACLIVCRRRLLISLRSRCSFSLDADDVLLRAAGIRAA